MKVTIVSDVFGEPNNGTTIAAMHLIKALSEKGHTVRILCPDKDKKHLANYFVVGTFDFGPFNTIVDKNGVKLAKGDTVTIARALHDTDEVHIMMPFALGRKTLKIAHRLGIPASAGFHVQAENVTSHLFNWMDSRFINLIVYHNFYDHFYKGVDAIHYPTQFIRDTFEKAVKHTTPGYVISNGVSKDFHHKDIVRPADVDHKFVILCTGRFSKEKKQRLLIKAWALSKHKDDIQVVFAGEGPRLEEMKREATKCGVSPIYRFFTRPELVDAINCSDLYVHTSEVEIEAISCLEAISCGIVPVINDSPKSATRYFALTPNNLFSLNNPTDLAKKIDYWIEHPEEREKNIALYAPFAHRFDFDHCMEEMEKMILNVAALGPAKKEKLGIKKNG